MAIEDDLRREVRAIFAEQWETKEAQVVPKPEDLTLSNDVRHFDRATVLYADLSGSTALVNEQHWQLSREVYKTYLACAARIIKEKGGQITAYDGDRIMAVFIEGAQTSNAATLRRTRFPCLCRAEADSH